MHTQVLSLIWHPVLGCLGLDFLGSCNPLDHIPGLDTIKNIIGAAGRIISLIIEFFTDAGQFFKDLIGWIVSSIFPPQMQDWFIGTLSGNPSTMQNGKATSIYQNLYTSAAVGGIAVAAAAAGARCIKVLLDHRAPANVMFVEVIPRFFVAASFIGFGSFHPGYDILNWAVTVSFSLCKVMWDTFSSAGGQAMPGVGHLLFDAGVSGFIGINITSLFLLIAFIIAFLMLVYCFILMVARTIMLGFCFAMAPLAIGTGIYDHKNRFFTFWWDMFLGSLMIPCILGSILSITFALAIGVGNSQAGILGPLAAMIMVCGGAWFAAKAVQQLTWKHFSHGNMRGALLGGIGMLSLDINGATSIAKSMGGMLTGSKGGGAAGAAGSVAGAAAAYAGGGAGGGAAGARTAGTPSGPTGPTGKGGPDGKPGPDGRPVSPSGAPLPTFSGSKMASPQFSQLANEGTAGGTEGMDNYLTGKLDKLMPDDEVMSLTSAMPAESRWEDRQVAAAESLSASDPTRVSQWADKYSAKYLHHETATV